MARSAEPKKESITIVFAGAVGTPFKALQLLKLKSNETLLNDFHMHTIGKGEFQVDIFHDDLANVRAGIIKGLEESNRVIEQPDGSLLVVVNSKYKL